MPFRNDNIGAGLPINGPYQVGGSNADNNLTVVERDITVPTVSSGEASWLYFECYISTMLDSGIVVHNRLPQVNNEFDTLSLNEKYGSSAYKDTFDTAGGINLKCKDQYQDIVQRMGHARYWFRLYGKALRIRYQVPIPSIKTIGGVPAIPYDKNPQWAYNSIVPSGNFGSVILWKAEWSLWYTTVVPPINLTIPTSDPSGHIVSTDQQPREVQAPFSQADDNSTTIAANVRGVGAAARRILGQN